MKSEDDEITACVRYPRKLGLQDMLLRLLLTCMVGGALGMTLVAIIWVVDFLL